MEVMNQTSKMPFWADEKGIEIPYSRTTKTERLMERHSAKLVREASKVNERLVKFKEDVRTLCKEVYDTFIAEKGMDDRERKGNFTFYNFNRSIKVEVTVSDRIEFDDLTIMACKEKLNEFLQENVESKDQVIKQMVLDAFETSRGKLDAKKVMSLLRYRSKIKSPLFQEAMVLLEESIRRPSSKTYFRIWTRNEEGKYESIELNFSNI